MTDQIAGPVAAIAAPAESSDSNGESEPRRRRTRLVVASIALTGLLIVFAPSIAARTGLRHALINETASRYGLSGSVHQASLGWIAPIDLQQIALADPTGQVTCDVDQVVSEKTLFDLILSGNDRGPFRILSPRMNVVLNENGQWPLQRKRRAGRRSWAAKMTDVSFAIRPFEDAAPIVDLEGLDLDVRLQAHDAGRTLTVGRIAIVDLAPLSPDLCDRGLRLIAPMLADATSMSGEVSISLDSIEAELDSDQEGQTVPEVAGTVQFHHISAALKHPMVTSIAQLVAQRADIAIPQAVQVVGDSEVRFRVSEQGVSHSGLAFVLPEFSNDVIVRSSGTVKFDETLELDVEIALPESLSGGQPLLASLLRQPIRFRLTGPLDSPAVALPDGRSLLDEIANRVVPAEFQKDDNLPNAIIDLVGGLTEDPDAAMESLPGSIFRIIRAVDGLNKDDDEADH